MKYTSYFSVLITEASIAFINSLVVPGSMVLFRVIVGAIKKTILSKNCNQLVTYQRKPAPMNINLPTTWYIACVKHAERRMAGHSFCLLLLLVILPCFVPVFSQVLPFQPANAQPNTTFSKSNEKEAAVKIREVAAQTLKATSNDIWFEKNDGQYNNPEVLYGFRTAFGSMGVYENKLRVVTEQTADGKNIGRQVVDISFPGSLKNWAIVPGSHAVVKGTYNTSCGSFNAQIYNEITLKNVYAGVDLRLYAGEQGALEFDWLVQKAVDYENIRMNFKGQDGINIEKNGDILIDLKQDDLKIVIPETYQVINGKKKLFDANMCTSGDNATLKYEIAGNMDPNLPLVIDPVMIWSTYLHNNTKTFDEYLYTIAVNTASEVYACGLTSEAISTAYMSGVLPGFSSAYNPALISVGKEQAVILYRLNPAGTVITAWTYTGQSANVPVALGIFPNNRVLVVYQTDTVQIFSADLTTRYYSDNITGTIGSNVLSYQSQAIIDNDVFYLGGVAGSALPASIIPATAPDPVIAGTEGLILRITNASTAPTASWGTYVGGSANEAFTAIAVTPDKTKLTFAVHVDGTGTGYPALVNDVDNTISGTELLIGVMPVGTPTAFSVFSYLGGTSDEGKSTKESSAALVAADNNYFYVAGNTISTDLPGTAGSAQPTHGANKKFSDQFLSQIPLGGSASAGFITTYNGGDANDIVGGLVIDFRTKDVLLFGTTESTNFPVYNAVAYSPFYQATHGSTASGPLDITYTVFNNGLAARKFSTYIGGDHNDYLGSTGKLEGTGHFQYNTTNGLTYIGTTIHSDQTTLPPQWMTDIPGFDKVIPTATTGKDNHFIFAMNPNTSDFGDAPASYDAGTPANSAVVFFKLRIGAEEDAEEKPNSSPVANGDDNQNFGSTDDEDGVFYLPSIAIGDTNYSVTVSVFNNTGVTINLNGWIDFNGNGIFDSNEYATVAVPAMAVDQFVVLNFTNLPPFTTTSGFTFLRLRIADVTLTAADATGTFGKGEVEDYVVLKTSILPISLQQFTAMPKAEKVWINWSVASSANVHHYQVEYSTDNINFTGLGTMPATQSRYYSWLHATPLTGANYYRLNITDANGAVTYSGVQTVVFGKRALLMVYPNPVKDILNITLTGSMINQSATIGLYSLDGRMLSRKKINALNQAESVDVSHLPGGQYILKIDTDHESFVRKIRVMNN